jgi:hypothetical protein
MMMTYAPYNLGMMSSIYAYRKILYSPIGEEEIELKIRGSRKYFLYMRCVSIGGHCR